MIRSIMRYSTNVAIAILVLGLVAILSKTFWSTDSFHHVILSSTIAPNIIHVGEPIHTHVVVDRFMPGCALELHRFIAKADGVVIWSQIVGGIAHSLNETQHIDRDVSPIPPLEPGKYIYFFTAINYCGAKNHIVASKKAPFEVIP